MAMAKTIISFFSLIFFFLDISYLFFWPFVLALYSCPNVVLLRMARKGALVNENKGPLATFAKGKK
jgi:hypothetical protein